MSNNDKEQLAALAAQPMPVVHAGTKCQRCNASPIRGIRYKCSICYDFDYCALCEENHHDKHPKAHVFLKIRTPLVHELLGSGGPIIGNFLEITEAN